MKTINTENLQKTEILNIRLNFFNYDSDHDDYLRPEGSRYNHDVIMNINKEITKRTSCNKNYSFLIPESFTE